MIKRNPGRAPRRGRKRLALAFGGCAAILVTVAAFTWPRHEPAVASAPVDVLGRSRPAATLHLLAFLATQPDTAAGPSRAEAVEIVSLLTQFGGEGLGGEILDESGAGGNSLINTYYDWHLGDVRLCTDPGRSLAARYGIASVPATVLVDGSGTVVARWDSAMPTAQAAQIITAKLS